MYVQDFMVDPSSCGVSLRDQRENILAEIDFLYDSPFDDEFTIVINGEEQACPSQLKAFERLFQASEGPLKKFYRDKVVEEKIRIKKDGRM